MRRISFVLGLAGALAATPALADKKQQVDPAQALVDAPASAWRTLDPENTLVMDLPSGPVVIELRADFAPKHVAQIKTLARRGFYNGLNFHRVIEGFVAQGGDPKADGTGGSDLPDIPAEFARDAKDVANFTEIGRDRMASRVGLVDGVPAGADPETMRSVLAVKKVTLWGAHCPGVMSMARATAPDSANSQFFLVMGDARQSLDQRYTVWGWIVDGSEHARRISRGEPPTRPTPIVRMRIAADIPEADRPKVEVMRSDSEAFGAYIKAAGFVDDKGFVKDLCDLKPPRRVKGQIEL
jgi:peptidylprolyl isomerase